VIKDTVVFTNSATIPDLIPQTEYVVKVRGQNLYNGEWSANCTFTTGEVYPGITNITSPANGATNISLPVAITWNPIPGINTYELALIQDDIIIFDTTIFSNTVILHGLAGNTLYSASVHGLTSTYSGDWSPVIQFITAPDVGYSLNPVLKNYGIQVFPNPTKGTLKIQYLLPEKSSVHLTLTDASGKMVQQLLNTTQLKGINKVELSILDQVNGTYFLNLNIRDHTGNTQIESQKIILQK